jgi:epsin
MCINNLGYFYIPFISIYREEDDLAKALQLSEQEAKEKEQHRANNQSSSSANFDALFTTYDQPQQQQQPLQIAWTQDATGTNNQFFDNSMTSTGIFQPVNNPYLQQQQQQQQSFQPSTFQQPQFQTSQMTGVPGAFVQPFHQSSQPPFGQSAFSDNNTPQHLTPFNSAPFQAPAPTGSRNPFSQPSSQGSQVFASFAQQQQQPLVESPTANAFGQATTPILSSTSSPFDAFKSASSPLPSTAISTPSSPFGTPQQPFMPSSPAAGQSRPFVS